MSTPTIVEVEGRTLKLTNLDKILYPATGFTKGQVVDYYVRIAPVLVPHLVGRPLTMKRYPGGVGEEQEFFFEKNAPKHRPDWVKTAPVWSEGNHRTINYLLANDLAHPDLDREPGLDRTASIALARARDLDPDHDRFRSRPRSAREHCAMLPGRPLGARDLRTFRTAEFSQDFGVEGLQIYIPLNTKTTYEQTKQFAHAIARLLEQEHPDLVVSDMKKAIRTNKVFVDWSQNDQHKTTISVYSLRARETRPCRRR
jgi:bifunctional non-homologous end joining protein LigD